MLYLPTLVCHSLHGVADGNTNCAHGTVISRVNNTPEVENNISNDTLEVDDDARIVSLFHYEMGLTEVKENNLLSFTSR